MQALKEEEEEGLLWMQEKKALSSRGRGRLRGFLELRRPWGFSPEARRQACGLILSFFYSFIQRVFKIIIQQAFFSA